MLKRLITKRQERALKLCHHDFGGLTQKEAAKIMGITPASLSGLLSRVKKVYPCYFPLITKQEAKIYHYYMVDGWSVSEIAEYMELTERAVYDSFKRAQRKDMHFTEARGRVLSWDKFIDDGGNENEIKHKF